MSRPPASPEVAPTSPEQPVATLLAARAFGLIREDLEKVEEILRYSFQSQRRTLPFAFAHSVGAGGKRIRPALVLLSARAAGGAVSREIIQLAAAIEAIHLASLIHDDVIDHSHTRRGAQSVNRRWGDEVSILLADFIFSTTLAQMCSFAPREVLRLVAEAVAKMSEAELEQIENRNNLSFSEAEYLRVIQGKTGALMAACCAAGAMVAGAERPVSLFLSQFGAKMGTAFQLVDDLLDFVGHPSKTGKPRGKDVLEGKMTLPLICSLSRWDGRGRDLLAQVLGAGQAGPSEIQAVIDLVLKVGGVDYAHQRAREFAQEAKGCLSSFPPSAAIEALKASADFATEREA